MCRVEPVAQGAQCPVVAAEEEVVVPVPDEMAVDEMALAQETRRAAVADEETPEPRRLRRNLMPRWRTTSVEVVRVLPPLPQQRHLVQRTLRPAQLPLLTISI